MSERMSATENPYIEDVLEKYSSIPNLTMMALGSSYWEPPAEALQTLQNDLRKLNFKDVSKMIMPLSLLTQSLFPQIKKEPIDMVTSWAALR